MAAAKSKFVVYAASIGNALVALTKFVAAWWTGSSAMLSEAIHSLVDTGNQLLLLYGIHRAARPPDDLHPLGHGREIYFWSFVVALLMFTLGAGVACYEGVQHILSPHEIVDPTVSYVVLGCAALFEGTSWLVALREFRKAKGDLGYFEAVRRSKDPLTFTVLFEDSAALLGLLVALAGIALAQALGDPRFDGYASLGIGVVLAVAALLLARETKGLLIGEAAGAGVREDILRIAAADRSIRCANGVLTVQMGPRSIVAALSAEFEDALATPDIERCIRRIEDAVRAAHPDVVALFVKPQTAGTWARRAARLRGDED